jgi:hypothetical protein
MDFVSALPSGGHEPVHRAAFGAATPTVWRNSTMRRAPDHAARA